MSTLNRAAKRRVFGPGEVLFSRGGPPQEIFALHEGRVKIWRTSQDGVTQTLLMLGRGDLIGSLAVVQDTPHPVTASAITAVRASAWPAAKFLAALNADPALAERTLRLVAGRAEQMLDRLEEITSVPLEQRLARVLLRLAADCGQECDGDGIRIVITRQDLADLTSVTLPTVSRIMSRWRRGGLIAGGRGEVNMPAPSRIAEMAGVVPADH